MKKMLVKISGPMGCGKSQLAQRIAGLLLQEGIYVELNDGGNPVEDVQTMMHIPSSTQVSIVVEQH